MCTNKEKLQYRQHHVAHGLIESNLALHKHGTAEIGHVKFSFEKYGDMSNKARQYSSELCCPIQGPAPIPCCTPDTLNVAKQSCNML